MTDTATKSFQKGYKYRVYPTLEQKEKLAQLFGSCRFVWNKLVAKTQADYEAYQEQLRLEVTPTPDYPQTDGYYFSSLLPALKAEHPWLKDVSSVAVQQVALRLGKAYSTFFKGRKLKRRTGKPKFKSKRDKQSASLVGEAFRVCGGKLALGKINGTIDVLWSRKLPSDPTSCTITLDACGHYYASFVCEYTPAKTTGTKVTGIDLGLTHLATLSDGTKIDNPKHYQKAQCKLKRLQQALSRKKKGSINRNKARLKLAKQHAHIAAQRFDYHHKLSRRLVNDNQVIGLETLKVMNMLKNPKLAKGIASVSWSTLTSQIAYKAKESGHCVVVMMDPFYPSSHLCSVTGKHLGRKLELKERSWTCPHCGEVHDRDVNAAQNIAIKAMACADFHGLLRQPHTGTVYVADLK